MSARLALAFILIFVAGIAPASDIVLSPNGTAYRTRTSDGETCVHVAFQEVRGSGVSAASDSTATSETRVVLDGATGEVSLALDSSSETLFAAYATQDALKVLAIRANEQVGIPVVAALGHVTALKATITERAELPSGGSIAAVTLHLFWRDGSGYPRYASAAIEDGFLAQPEMHDLKSLFGTAVFERVIVISEGASKSAVDLVLTSSTEAAAYRARLTPVADHRIRIPVGAKPRRVGIPERFPISRDGVSAIVGADDQLAIYVVDDRNRLQYVIIDGSTARKDHAVTLSPDRGRESVPGLLRPLVRGQ